ncbi:MAG TPA: MarR family transcriptional regulator [Streptosporangiaceae bacterium]|nr:MarR family transcriptional regulator [Streptosporangiaceae bacterium]
MPVSASSAPADAASADTSPAAGPGQSGPPAPVGQRAIDAARLRVAVLRLSRRLRKHDLAGLTPSQLSTLSCVGKTGPVRLGDLAAAERIAPSTLTRLVNVLEDRGYLLRKPAPEDARAYLVTLTDSGNDVLARIRDEATSMLTDILMTLTPEQMAALEAALPALEQLAGSG